MDLKPATRRRGEELETAILDAAWQQLNDGGYQNFTFEAVAERAQTSKSVVYRRWPTRQELLIAAGRHHRDQLMEPELPDTGSLRGDVIAALRSANPRKSEFAAIVSANLGTFFNESGFSPADLRAMLLEGRETRIGRILKRAVERGEVDPARLTPRIVDLPFDLYRHEVLMTLRAVPDDVIEQIVDEVFLPLVQPRG